MLQVSIAHQPMRLVRPALLLAPAYFCLNYTYFLSLDLTSVSETMILSSCAASARAVGSGLLWTGARVGWSGGMEGWDGLCGGGALER